MSAGWTRGHPVEDADARTCLQQARACLRDHDDEAAQRWVFAAVDRSEDLTVWLSAARLTAQAGRPPGLTLRPARVAVVGTTTTAHLVELLPVAAARAGLAIEVHEAAFDQLEQQVLDPGSALYAFAPDVVVLAVHEGDVHFRGAPVDPHDDVAAEVARWSELWSVVRSTCGASVLQLGFVVPDEPALGHYALHDPASREDRLRQLNRGLAQSTGPGVALLDCDRLASTAGKHRWSDPRYWYKARLAVSLAELPRLARGLAAVLAAQLGTSRKVVAVDLDGTLWGGVLGEDGIDGLALGTGEQGEAFSAFQDYLLALKQRGVLLAICSKNDDALVRQAFDEQPSMRLSLSDFAVVSAGWQDKPAQLEAMATTLNLALGSFVFVDDNPVEREAVRNLVPDVDVLALPAHPSGYVRALSGYPYLETVSITAEDRQRTQQYRARHEADQLLRESPTIEAYLRSLQMRADVVPVDEASLPRLAQLVGKTNQFNLTGRRHSIDGLRAYARDEATVLLALRLADRFTDHGIVALLIAEQVGEELLVDTWLMSCRVIGRTLEHEMLDLLEQQARERGVARLVGHFVPSGRNQLVGELYPRLGFRPVAATGDSCADDPADDVTTIWVRAVPHEEQRSSVMTLSEQQGQVRP